jgi:hypothetical protein
MDYDYNNCGTESPSAAMLKAGVGGMLIPPTLKQRLEMQKTQIEAQLGNVNAALGALDENPDVENVINALAKVGIR